MLRRGVAVLLAVGAMVAWSAQPAAADPSRTNLYLTVCTAGSCQVVPVEQPYNSTLATVLSTVDGGAYTALGVCLSARQENIPLSNGGTLSVCPASQQLERRRDVVRYVDPEGQTHAVGIYDGSNHICLQRTGYGAYTGDAYSYGPVVELSHEEYPCTV